VKALVVYHKEPRLAYEAVRALEKLARLHRSCATLLCELEVWGALEPAMRGNRLDVWTQVGGRRWLTATLTYSRTAW
jgi:hypothetical protein